MTHEDNRRRLISFPYKEGEIKVIVAKQHCLLGDHYHKIKTEVFTLLEGAATATVGNKSYEMNVKETVIVLPEERHSFFLHKDSILFCVCSHPYDNEDDYQ